MNKWHAPCSRLHMSIHPVQVPTHLSTHVSEHMHTHVTESTQVRGAAEGKPSSLPEEVRLHTHRRKCLYNDLWARVCAHGRTSPRTCPTPARIPANMSKRTIVPRFMLACMVHRSRPIHACPPTSAQELGCPYTCPPTSAQELGCP